MTYESWVSVEEFALVKDAEFWAAYAAADPTPAPDSELGEKYLAYQVALEEATWVLNTLAGGKIHPEECWIEDYNVGRRCRLKLRRSPIEAIVKVEAVEACTGEAIRELSYCQLSHDTISFCGTDPYASFRDTPLCGSNRQQIVRVYYRLKSTLPPGTQSKIIYLAHQLFLAATGGKNCELPQRVTSINRGGTSWTLLDPMDYIEKGLIGTARIDTWLMIARREHGMASLIDPLLSNRVATQKVSCTGSGTVWPVPPLTVISGAAGMNFVIDTDTPWSVSLFFQDTDVTTWTLAAEIKDSDGAVVASSQGVSPSLSFSASGTYRQTFHLDQDAIDALEIGEEFTYRIWRTDVTENAELFEGTIERRD